MTEAARTIAQQRLFIWALVIVIAALLVLLHRAREKLREKDLDGKLARGRRKQRRMEQHPRRMQAKACDIDESTKREIAKQTAIAINAMDRAQAAAMGLTKENLGRVFDDD